jgi:hypothetical protein
MGKGDRDMETTAEEYIDKTQWLPRGEPAIKVERLAKGDIKRFKDEELHLEGVKSFMWAPDELLRLGVILKEHHDTASTIARLRDAAMRFCNPSARIAIIKIENATGRVSNLAGDDIYFGMIRGLHRLKGGAKNPEGVSLAKIFGSIRSGLTKTDDWFELVVAPLMLRHSHMVDRICFQPVRSNDYGWIKLCQESVRDAFVSANEKLRQLYEFSEENA